MTISRRNLLNWILPSAVLTLFSTRSSAAGTGEARLNTHPTAGHSPAAAAEQTADFFRGEGKESVGSGTASVFERVKQRGQFDVVQGVSDPKGIAGMVFGGPNNRAALIIDERGRMQTYATKEGRPSAARVAIPFSEPYGQGVAAWNGSILRMPFAGAEDDTLHSSLIFIPKTDGSADMYIAGPGQYTDYGAPYGGAGVVAPRALTEKDLIAPLRRGSVYPTGWNSQPYWVKLFTIRTGVRSSGPNFTGLYISGGTLSESIYTYLIQCNDVLVSSLNASTAKHVLRITNLRDPSDSRHDISDLTQFGYVYDVANNMLMVYAKIAARNEGATFIPLRYTDAANSGVDKVIINSSDDEHVTSEPEGIVYVETANSLTSNTYVPLNDGRVVKTLGAVIRISDAISAATRSPVQDGFKQNDNLSAINRGYAQSGKVMVTKESTGKYKVTGASTITKNSAWRVSNPMIAGGAGIQHLVAAIESDTANTLVIGVRALKYVYNSSEGSVTPVAGDYTDIPADSWVDIHTTLL
jgi:hypothetical protein